MSVAASLNVLLTASAAQFTTTIDNAQKTLSRFGNTVKSVAPAIGAGLSLGAIVRGTLRTVDAFDQADKAAERLGMTYNSLVTLQQAANMSGSSAETMNSALQKMTVLLGKAELGEKGAADALQQMGLSFATLKDLSPEEQFAQIMQAIGSMPSAMARAAAMQDVFGNGAAELGSLIGMTTEKMRELRREFESKGVLLTPVQQKVMREAAESVDRIKLAWQGLTTQLSAVFAPAITAAINGISSAIERMSGLLGKASASIIAFIQGNSGAMGMLGMSSAAPPAAAAPVVPPQEKKWQWQAPAAIRGGTQQDSIRTFQNRLDRFGVQPAQNQVSLLNQANQLLARIERHLATPEPVYTV